MDILDKDRYFFITPPCVSVRDQKTGRMVYDCYTDVRVFAISVNRFSQQCYRVVKWGFVEDPKFYAFHVDFEKLIHSRTFKMASYLVRLEREEGGIKEINITQSGELREEQLLELIWQTNKFDRIPELMKAENYEKW